MKSLILILVIQLFCLSALAGNSTYPYVAQRIRCLVTNSARSETQPTKRVSIDKIQHSPEEFEYSLKAGIRSELDFGTRVDFEKGRFHQVTQMFEVSVKLLEETSANFENPHRMEPFFAAYRCKSDFLSIDDELLLKCLHVVF